MLSRVAENIYWMARYIERAENTARLVSVNAFLLLDLPRGVIPEWEPLIYITGSESDYESKQKDYNERSVVRYLIGNTSNPSSILSSLQYARANIRSVREALPRTAWEQLTELYLYAKDNVQTGISKNGRHTYLKRIIEGSQLLVGCLNATMIHDEAYHIMRIGRHLERADMTTRIVDVRSANLLPPNTTELQPFQTIQWMSVLNSLSAYHMYRKRMHSQVIRRDVLQFLLKDEQFPRSFYYGLMAVKEGLDKMPNNSLPLNTLQTLAHKVRRKNVTNLKQGNLHEFLDQLQQDLNKLHNSINQAYFEHLYVHRETIAKAG